MSLDPTSLSNHVRVLVKEGRRRLLTLTAGVFCLAGAGPVQNTLLRALLIVAAVALVGLTFRLDRGARSNLFPPRALSLGAPIGLALWILSLHGMTQTSVSLFLPLLLQVVHGVSPVFINIVNIVISLGWTIGTFSVSGWSGRRERFALFIQLYRQRIVYRPSLSNVCPGHRGERRKHFGQQFVGRERGRAHAV